MTAGNTTTSAGAQHAAMPDPSPELILMLALAQSLALSLGRKGRARFMENMTGVLGVQEASQNVLRFRSRPEDREVSKALAQAREWWSRAQLAMPR